MAFATLPMQPNITIIWAAPEDYKRYRRRKLWLTIRERIWERDGHRCVRCSGKATIVHHRTYDPEVMAGRADEGLVSLCDGCHTVVHYNEVGEWRSWEEAEKILATFDGNALFPEPVVDLRLRNTPRPAEWERMSALQRSGWIRRAHEIRTSKRKIRSKHNPTVAHYPTSDAAEKAAHAILDTHPQLKGRFRDNWQVLYLALMSQGHQLYGNGTTITSGIKPEKAKRHFDSFARSATVERGHASISERDVAELEALGVWHSVIPKRKKSSKK
jgi:hypothetical protein